MPGRHTGRPSPRKPLHEPQAGQVERHVATQCGQKAALDGGVAAQAAGNRPADRIQHAGEVAEQGHHQRIDVLARAGQARNAGPGVDRRYAVQGADTLEVVAFAPQEAVEEGRGNEAPGVHGEKRGRHRAQLAVQIDADGDAGLGAQGVEHARQLARQIAVNGALDGFGDELPQGAPAFGPKVFPTEANRSFRPLTQVTK